MSTGTTTILNMEPEVPLQVLEDFLSTPMDYLIYSFGADLHYAEPHMSKTTRMLRYNELDTEGGLLDGSGIDPAPEVVTRTDIDAETEIYAKTLRVNEQVQLYENDKVLTKFNALLGQWMREKENILMRDLYAAGVAYINATGGTNGDQPSEITRNSVNNIERLLLSNKARTILKNIEARDAFGTAPTRNAFIALASTDITPDLQNVQGVVLTDSYGYTEGIREEEYCSISRFRFFVSSVSIVEENASLLGANVYRIPMYGVEAAAKIEQNGYSAKVGYRPPWVVSSVAQNSELYAKFAIARAITNTNWVSGLNVTQRL